MNRWISRANKRVSMGNAATLLVIVALMAQILGFFRNRLISTNFTQVEPGSTDAFFAAFQIPDFFYLAIAAGALTVAFVPVLSDRLQKGDKQGMWDITNSLLNLTTIIMCIAAVIIFVYAEPLLSKIVAPGLPPDRLGEATTIMRFVALNPLFFALSGIVTSVQQTYGRFFFFAISPLFYNLAIIASIYLFKDSMGVVGLGVGALAGGILQFSVALLGLWGLKFRYRLRINFRSAHFLQVLRALPARSVDQGIDSINSIVETNRATALGGGAVSYYNFATSLHNVPVILFGSTIATAAFPRLAARLSQHRPDLFHKDFFKVLRFMIWLAMPVVVVSYFCRGYLARLLYGDVAPSVALIFGFLSAAILFRIIYAIISRYFYAQKDTVTPLLISLFAIGLNIYLVFNLARPSSYGMAGLALAQSITAGVEVVLMFVVMFIRDRALLNKAFWGSIVRIISVTGFTVMAAFIMVSLLPLELSDRGFVTLGVKFGLITAVTFSVHIAISLLFSLNEPKPLVDKIRRLILKPLPIDI